MKTTLVYLLLFFSIFSVSAQNRNRAPGPNRYDETVYVFMTYEDFKNNKLVKKGHFEGYTWGNMGRGTKIKVKLDSGKTESISVDDFWGFKIDKYIFRSLKNELPVAIVGKKEKCFYINGAFYLSMIYHNATSGMNINDSETLFYSDEENSKVMELDKLRKEQKDNPTFIPLFECFKLAKKNRKDKDDVTGQIRCLFEFVE